ncbi:MAG: PAS domain S-box protein [Promethearchaeota archaeon]
MGISERNLMLITDHVNDLICILNQNFDIEFINEKVYQNILGYSTKELVGNNIKTFIESKNFKEFRKLLENYDDVENNQLEIRFLHKDGNFLWLLGKITHYKEHGGGNKILLIMSDISKRKEFELSLKDSTEKYESIINNIKEGYYEVDLRGNFVYANDALCSLLGYTREELMGNPYEIVTDTGVRTLVFNTYNKVFRTEIQQNIFQFEVRRKNGETAFFETSVYLKHDSKGQKIGFYGIVRDITDRKKEDDLKERFKIELTQKVRLSTKELEESQEKYGNLFKHSNDGIFLHDLEGTIIDVNQKVLELFGYTKNEICSLKIPDLHPISERSESKKAFEEISKWGYVRIEINFKKKNGEIFPAEVSSSLFNVGENKVIQGIVRDITVRRQSEQKLRESEIKYRKMINNLDLGFYQVNWNGKLLNYNPTFSNLLGYAPEEKIKNINVNQFWQFPQERDKYLTELKQQGFVKNYIVQSKTKDDRKIVLQLNSHLLEENKENQFVIEGLISDITKKFELEQKLKDSERRYRNLIESVPFSIALIDQTGKVIYCNPATEKLLGFSVKELVGNEFRQLPAINQKYLPEMLNRFILVAKGEVLSPFEVELYKKDGSTIWVQYQTNLVKLEDKFLIHAILNDITERKKADFLIQEEIQKLKNLDQIRKDLISRVSHELKTPLVSVCGASELLLELSKDELNEETIELIKMIEKGGTRLKYLVDNLLDITRIEYNKLELEKKRNNLGEIIEECAKEMIIISKKRKIELTRELQNEILLDIDRVRIEQVIFNLLSNAIKNTPPNGLIKLRLLKKQEWAIFSVEDSGIGLTRDEIERIFTRFGKIERYGEGLEYIDIQGSGLGLYISKEIIDLHEGQIWADSRGRNKGSTFTIKLPINQ